ncbi:MAG: hypothetical protein N4A43_01665 [Alphaproteobacteria bacterium]|jgi:hypothetical protein|nr:hypothetical protein [Alphaproteobacteria bacterium]
MLKQILKSNVTLVLGAIIVVAASPKIINVGQERKFNLLLEENSEYKQCLSSYKERLDAKKPVIKDYEVFFIRKIIKSKNKDLLKSFLKGNLNKGSVNSLLRINNYKKRIRNNPKLMKEYNKQIINIANSGKDNINKQNDLVLN